VRFFLDADVDERAKRRYEQLIENGGKANLAEVKRGLEVRDYRDTRRAIAPLRPADDSVIIDTTGIGVEEVINKMTIIVEKHAKQAGS